MHAPRKMNDDIIIASKTQLSLYYAVKQNKGAYMRWRLLPLHEQALLRHQSKRFELLSQLIGFFGIVQGIHANHLVPGSNFMLEVRWKLIL